VTDRIQRVYYWTRSSAKTQAVGYADGKCVPITKLLMSETIIAALIGGFFSILVAVITIYHQDIFSVFRYRKRRIKGNWRGKGVERFLKPDSVELQNEYDILMRFHQLGSRITGTGMGISNLGEHYEANLKGKMEDEHIVTILARSISPQEFDIAVMLFELDAKGKKIKGYSLATGLTQHGITFSEISLDKEPD
jgi:hypothetical protein